GPRRGGAPGLAPGRARRVVQEGVRLATRARRRADPCIHARGAAPRGLGLQIDGRDEDARLARPPPAEEARVRPGPVRDQRLGGRLSTDRRSGRPMSHAIAIAGWVAAAVTLAAAGTVRRA